MSLREDLKNVSRETAKQGADLLVKEASKGFIAWVAGFFTPEAKARRKARREARRARRAAGK